MLILFFPPSKSFIFVFAVNPNQTPSPKKMFILVELLLKILNNQIQITDLGGFQYTLNSMAMYAVRTIVLKISNQIM